jgi:hypothetical protein
MHWRKVTSGTRGDQFPAFLGKLNEVLSALPTGAVWRHNQAGDLPGSGDRINRSQAMGIAKTNKSNKSRGFTYTHKPVLSGPFAVSNRAVVKDMNQSGFTVNLSANNLAHADELASLAIAPVVVVLPSSTVGKATETPGGRKVVVCPAQRVQGMTCSKCKLCSLSNGNRPIIGFIAHGSKSKNVDTVAG